MMYIGVKVAVKVINTMKINIFKNLKSTKILIGLYKL